MLAGTEKFIRQAIEGAASKSMQIEFVDPAHNALLQELKQKSLVKREIIRRQEERQQRAEQAKTAEKKTAAAALEVDAKFPVPGKSLVKGAGKEPRRGPQPAPEAQRQRAQHNELKEQDRDRECDVDADR